MGNWLQHITTNNKAIVLADQVVFSGNSFLTTILMARILTATDFGVYASILLFVLLITGILNAIIMQPLQVTLAKIFNTTSYIAFSFWLQLGILLFVLAGTAFILNLEIPLLVLFNDLSLGLVLLAFGFVMQDYFRKLFLASSQLLRSLQVDVLTALLHFIILISALFFIDFSLLNLLICLGIAYVPAIVLGVVFIKPKPYKALRWDVYLMTHIQQSKWLLLTTLVQWWSSNLFVVISGVFLGIKALGAFRLVQSVFGVFNLLLQTFENYVLPKASSLLKDSHQHAKEYIKKVGYTSVVLFALVLFPIFIFSENIIVLIGGSTYAEYSFVVKGMAILYFFIFLGYPIRIAIRVLILNRNFFVGYAFSLLFSLLSFNYLLQQWELMGAIAGLIISQIIVLSYWQFILIKKNFVLWK